MKKRGFRYDEGGEVDALEEYNKGENLDTAPGPKAEPEPEKPKAKAKPPAGTPGGANRGQRAESPSPQRVEVTAKKYPKDDESKSVSERAKAARERARMGSTGTDERSVTERMGGTERKGSSTSTDTRSISDRMKAMRESARSGGSKTDTRSVGERIRGALGFAKGGSVRGDGCAQRGKTKGRML
jgi:hypothetical protein